MSVEEAMAKAREKNVLPEIDDRNSIDGDESEDSTNFDAQDKPAGDEPIELDAEDSTVEQPPKAAPPKADFRFKYASHEEAENGVKEAERKMHEALDVARQLKAQVDQMQSQNSQAVKTGKITTEQGKAEELNLAEVIKKINQLDPEADDYESQVAEAWEGGISKVVESRAQRIVSEAFEKREQAKSQAQIQEEAKINAVMSAEKAAKEAGFDMTADSPDEKLFWSFVSQALPHGNTVEERIAWAVKEARAIKNSYVARSSEISEKVKKNQNNNRVLEKGSSRVADRGGGIESPESPLSVTDAFSKASRRI